MSKTIYHYAPGTGLFVGASEADESPMEKGVYLIPGFATELSPPTAQGREVAVFRGGEWVLVPDWRGASLYSTETGQSAQIDAPGIRPDDVGLTDLVPPSPGALEVAVFRGGQWVLVPDWRGAQLYRTTDGTPASITEIGQTPADVGATEQPMPSPAHAWSGSAWQIDPAKLAALVESAKTQALAAIDQHHTEVIQRLVGNPTQVEKDTWALKLETASAIAAGVAPGPAGLAFLGAAGITSATDQTAWAASVLRKSAGYATVVGLAERLRDDAKAAVKSANTVDGIQSALAEQRTKAEQAVSALLAKV